MPVSPEKSELAASQSAFAQALLHDEAPRQRGFAIHRNNVRASLAAAVAARYPVIERLVGNEFFTATALAFIGRHPPRSPVIAEYGEAFPDFLDRFEPVAELPFLGDVARLEWKRNVAFHARDAQPLDIGVLADVSAECLERVSITLHPAAAVVASAWPVLSIWRTNTFDEMPRLAGADLPGEVVLVTRPAQQVLVNSLPEDGELLFDALARGRRLGDAVSSMPPGFDLSTTLATLFSAGAIVRLTEGSGA